MSEPMPHYCSRPESRRPAQRQGLVIAAIGFQLLLCSLASAAGACSDTLDRSARRLPAQMAQVLREIVERHTAARLEHARRDAGNRLIDCCRLEPTTAPLGPVFAAQRLTLGSLLDLPPPARG